ncbi:hypothetical protein M422DRAFT_262017 [Sphaerobolus stellatus SS14]|uniref:Uncharacterized protein n=1 Tax=Sphaerobolus stellatus (strain SS14) TaxID=990650 RepID=A0A0C9UL56_SPHS4|nr:hypothetical protein M422DRAFT_262017 [Sphaerobolus stellatus SS14]
MSYAPPAVPPYPSNFYDQRQYRQNSKPPVPPLPPDFHPEQSVVSPMPERIMPNLPADVRPKLIVYNQQRHPHRASSVYPPLKQYGAYPPDPNRGAHPPQHQHQQGHLAPGEFARPQSAFGSHPVPPPPDSYGASPSLYASYNMQPMPSPSGSPPPPPQHHASKTGQHGVALPFPFRAARPTCNHVFPHYTAQRRPRTWSPNSPELTAPIPTKDTLLAAQKMLPLTYAGITNHLLEILVMMVECTDNTNSTLLRLTVACHRLYDHINSNHLELLHPRLETRRSQCFSMIHILYLGNF